MSAEQEVTPVIVAVIDDGIAFIHERFRTRSSPRVEYWWQQDGISNASGPTAPPGYILDKPTIKSLLNQCTINGVVDEDLFYARTGLIDFAQPDHKAAAWHMAHGTHVMDTATGYDWWEKKTSRPIVAVQLPTATTADTSGASLTAHVLSAIYFILDKADAIAHRQGRVYLPVVINLSYGLISGIYNSSGSPVPLEWLLDEIIKARRAYFNDDKRALEIVLPAGNSNLSRCHAEFAFDQTPVVTLNWRVQPDDRTPSFVDIILPLRTSDKPRDRVTLTMITPDGTRIGEPIGEDSRQVYSGAGCTVQYVAEPKPLPGAAPESARFRISLLPTADHEKPTEIAAAGLWSIELTNKVLTPHDVIHAYIQRDDTLYGYPTRGRQSYFDHECYERYDHAGREVEDDPQKPCVVRRAGLLNAIGRGSETVVMGGFIRKEDVAAPYSAAGPTHNSARVGPDAMCVSEDSRVHRGTLAAGTRSGSVVAMGGTSLAAPRATRWIAKQIALNKPSPWPGGREVIKKRAEKEEPGASRPHRPSPARGGAGRIGFDRVVLDPAKRYEGEFTDP